MAVYTFEIRVDDDNRDEVPYLAWTATVTSAAPEDMDPCEGGIGSTPFDALRSLVESLEHHAPEGVER